MPRSLCFLELSLALENEEFISAIAAVEFGGALLNPSNACYRCARNALLDVDRADELAFISSHCLEIDTALLQLLSLDDLVAVDSRCASETIRRLIGERRPLWGADQGLACFDDDDDEFRPPDAMWKVPVDCGRTEFARPRPIARPMGSRARLIRREDSDAISEILKGNQSVGTIPFAVFTAPEEESADFE
jgi:hypothetical protein